MARDFSAKQIRTSQLIASGGNGTEAQLLIYSASDTNSLVGSIPNFVHQDVGTDVFLFVSGSMSKAGSERTAGHPAVTLFGGDVVVSGTLFAERQVIEVDSVSDGDFFVTGNIFISSASAGDGNLFVGQHLFVSGNVSDLDFTGSIKASLGHVDIYGRDGVILSSNGKNIHLSGTVSDYDLSGTIKNSAPIFALSSVATEIRTTAGALTIDGKAGINLQEDNVDVLTIDDTRNFNVNAVAVGLTGSNSLSLKATKNMEIIAGEGITLDPGAAAGIHLSGSVSDFALTGTIKNSAPTVISSAVGTEIITTGGSLTIDGKTGINLQEDNVDVLTINDTRDFNVNAVAVGLTGSAELSLKAIKNIEIDAGEGILLSVGSGAGIYLSGSVSDFNVTGSIKNTDGNVDIYGRDGVTLSSNGKNIHLSGSVSDFALTGTIKNSAPIFALSSVATEIVTAAGALTISGETGVIISEAGNAVITIDTNKDVLFSHTGGSSGDPDVEIDGFTRFDGQTEFNALSTFVGDVGIAGTLSLTGTVSEFETTGTVKILSTADDPGLIINGAGIPITTRHTKPFFIVESGSLSKNIFSIGSAATDPETFVMVNADRQPVDFIVKGTGLRRALWVNSDNDNVGIGFNKETIAGPEARLHVSGVSATDTLFKVESPAHLQSSDTLTGDFIQVLSGNASGPDNEIFAINPTGTIHNLDRDQREFIVWNHFNYAAIACVAHPGPMVLISSGGGPQSFDPRNASDTTLFVSGTPDSIGAAAGGGVAAFGGDVVITGSLRARQLHFTTHNYIPGKTAIQYLRFNDVAADDAPGTSNKMVSPYSGNLVKVVVRASAAGASTEVGFHKAIDSVTNFPTAPDETVTVTMAAADTSYSFSFKSGSKPSEASRWNAGDAVGVSVNPTNDPGAVDVTCVWEFDTANDHL